MFRLCLQRFGFVSTLCVVFVEGHLGGLLVDGFRT